MRNEAELLEAHQMATKDNPLVLHGKEIETLTAAFRRDTEAFGCKTRVVISNFGHMYEYKAVAADVDGKRPVIRTKAQHAEFLKRNGYAEVGNEKPVSKPYEPPPSARDDIKKSFQQIMSR